MNGKFSAVVMGLLTLVYVFLLSNTGFTLLGMSSGVAKAMGALILVFPVFAIWLTIMEFRFGWRLEKLSKEIEAAGTWPELNFEFRPSGRATKESAATVFAEYAKKVAADEGNYLNWFALGLAYDAAGDRRRARAAMRRALKLSRG
ncbi:MAG: hypothetical protein RLZZ471_493 [Actinomycetota bacterium]|jgi:hypothetical protein